PISRGSWIVGKYAGLCLCLFVLAALLLVIWQGLMLINTYGWMSRHSLIVYIYMVISWMVQGALAILMASFMGQAIAMFSTLCLWIVGLASAIVANTISPASSGFTRSAAGLIARLWDFQQFNLVDYVQTKSWLSPDE